MTKSIIKTANQPITSSYPVVAIGASAGGLEAVSELLSNLPHNTGMAYIYIQHLDPSHKSMLSEILQRTTKMKVLEAENLLKIQPNHLYIIPPNKDMVIINEVLTLVHRQPKPSIHLPIDKFFISLAKNQMEASIGIVLSGNATDGTYGLRSIKLAGGLTFAQDKSAKFQSMPQSAITQGVVDLVLSPKDIAHELARISNHPFVPSIVQEETESITREEADNSDTTIKAIVQLLKKATGVDFSHYKMNTIRRRITRRMLIYKLDTLEDYLTYLTQQPSETHVLYQDILINVTSFFRDPEAVDYLKKYLVPRIIKSFKPEGPIRIWVPACASGEEAYSLAIAFREATGEDATFIAIQIFASDLSEVSISKARLGVYSKSDLADISSERLNKFFEKVDGGYRIVKSIRDLCIFATHNVLKDPPFSKLDLISCCNLMIYLDNILQKKLISIFHYALNKHGFLILGKSETISTAPNLFYQVEKKYKIFSIKKDVPNYGIFDMHPKLKDKLNSPKAALKEPSLNNDKASPGLERTIDAILLSEFIPASVVVNSSLEILQFRGSTNLFIEPASGKASLNLLKMARSSLGYELRNLVHKAGKTGERLKKMGLEIKIKSSIHNVSIEVIPLKINDNEEELFLIVFEETLLPSIAGSNNLASKNKLVKQLKDELIVAKEDMHSIIEEQEASVEELQSANEEIISSNEELQSINEELETSKEEVESANEELLTINTELQVRNEQLVESYEYSDAVFQTIEEAVLILNKDFRVKTANNAFYNIFKAKEAETQGALLYELGNGQWNILNFRELLDNVISNDRSVENIEVERDFPLVGKKIMLLSARKISQRAPRQDLIVLGIRDITEQTMAQKIIAEQEARFRNMANNVLVMIWTLDADQACNFMNKTRLKFTGRSIESELGSGWMDSIYKDDVARVKETYSIHFSERKPFKMEYRLKRYDGLYRWVSGEGEPNYSQEKEFIGFIIYCIEIHDKKLAHEEIEKVVDQRTKELQAAMIDLAHSNAELGQFAYVASHDLQEPIRKIITYSDRLQHSKQSRSETDQTYLNKILSSAEKMQKLINDVLNISKLSGAEIKSEDVNLNNVLHEVRKDFDLAIEDKKVNIDIEFLPVIKGYPVQLHQLFYNLVSNAIKFSSDERLTLILIRLKKLTLLEMAVHPLLNDKLSYIDITVNDNGIGFKQEFADQIFNIFQRLDNEHSKYAGSGIGLALCRKIVTNHKGLIFADSVVDQGATFHVILPSGMV